MIPIFGWISFVIHLLFNCMWWRLQNPNCALRVTTRQIDFLMSKEFLDLHFLTYTKQILIVRRSLPSEKIRKSVFSTVAHLISDQFINSGYGFDSIQTRKYLNLKITIFSHSIMSTCQLACLFRSNSKVQQTGKLWNMNLKKLWETYYNISNRTLVS